MKTDIKHKVINTKNGSLIIITNDGTERSLRVLGGKYGFESTKKILDEAIHMSPIGKPTKYFNVFNEVDQEEIEKWVNS
jgi:trehalose-6-phosphate synthase